MSRPRRPTRLLPALLLVSAGALLVRLFRLGERVAHQDEGRVGDWILHYMATDQWSYRAIIHGPFIPHVNGTVFSILGPSDFTARLVVAVVGGLLPLAALLFRDRLRDTEVVAMGLFLAANPVLLYYSRFMRNDVLLAAFVLVTVGFAVRAVDRPERRTRNLALATLFLALAFTTKENAILYVVAWAGSLALVADRRLLARESLVPRRLLGALDRADARTVGRAGLLGVALVAEFFVVFVAFYAPKPELYHALADPTKLPGVVSAATLGVWTEFSNTWLVSGMHDHSVVAFLGQFLHILVVGGAPLLVFAALGFLADRYGADSRALVGFFSYWGFASIVGYAISTDIMAGWTAVHVLAPLSLPAGVGVAYLYRKGRDAYEADDRIGASAAAVVLLVVAATTGGVAVWANFHAEQSPSNPLVQYAQPSGEMKPTLHEIERISTANDGVDVLFYGSEFYAPNDTAKQYGPASPGWFARLPLPWYFDQYGANVSSAKAVSDLEDGAPPVVVTLEKNAPEVERHLDGYSRVTYQGYLWGRPLVFFLDEDAPRTSSSTTVANDSVQVEHRGPGPV